ncbi:MAG: TolC family protein [Pirellulales bacterium]
MRPSPLLLIAWLALVGVLVGTPRGADAQLIHRLYRPEQRALDIRDPEWQPRTPLPANIPPTIVHRTAELDPQQMSLDQALQISLANSSVVRVLTGVTATTSGRTIYDASILNTTIDGQMSKFDPVLRVNNSWLATDSPTYNNLAAPPAIQGLQTDQYRLDMGVSKLTSAGGTAAVDLLTNPTRIGGNAFQPNPLFPTLNPSNQSSLQLSFTQPLLAGAGIDPNIASVVLARIDTERSFFQFKDAMQDMVRGTIEAYWQLVFARTDLWARQQQVEQAEVAVRLAEARVRAEISNSAELAQARLTLANFRATLIGAQANVLQREAALRNIIGLPPADGVTLVPVSPPSQERFEPNWVSLIEMAERQRPDLVELKLILEADQQTLIIARNQAQPRLDAFALYRWNGLEGELPSNVMVQSGGGQFTDWSLGVNFSVPLGLRQSRALLRRQELLIARDRANLEQGLHAAVHLLALQVRNIDQAYEQYLAYKEAREAARINLAQQLAQYRASRVIFLNVLQAITDWGNTVSAEANALLQYNIQLANLERQTGSILETHGITFFEERYGSLGPLGRFGAGVYYPESQPPTPNTERYPTSTEAAENSFDLRPPPTLRAPLQPNANPLPPPMP